MVFWLLLYFFISTFRNFLYPLALGVLFSYLLYPVASFLERKGLPRIPSNIISIILGMCLVYGIAFFIYSEIRRLIADIPNLQENAKANIDRILNDLEGVSVQLSAEKRTDLKEVLVNTIEQTAENLDAFISGTAHTVFVIGIMPVYVFFFLYYRNKYRNFALMLINDRHHERAKKTISELSSVAVRYMTGVTLVVLILCVLNTVGLLIVGVKYALLLGVIAAIWNFIPYIGTVIGYTFPLLVALLTGDGPGTAIGVVILFFIVQFTENNLLTPNITGSKVRINPFFIILGVLIGGVVWGVPGMFVVVPVLAGAKIICENVPRLQPWAFLIGDSGTEKHAVDFTKIKKLWQ
jgi:predicted PurR-regulated permease PerM